MTVLHEGAPVVDGVLGEINVSGPTVADGYLGDERSASTEFTSEGVRTGDAGFIYDGELFVVGRLGDSIKIRGRTVYSEDLEAKLTALRGVPKGRTVVLPGLDRGEESVTVVTETEHGDWVDPAMQVLRSEVGDQARIRIATVPIGTIPRTSSGKPRRRLLWQSVVDGTLPVLETSNLNEQPTPARERSAEAGEPRGQLHTPAEATNPTPSTPAA